MKLWCLLLTTGCALLLQGCASSLPPMPPTAGLFNDALFAPGARSVDAEQVFAMSPPMQDYLRQEIAPQLRRVGGRQALLDALYSRSALQLEYDAEHTRTAAEAFDARRGNCLSLVLMTASFARALGLPVRFNAVHVEEQWRRSGRFDVLSGHVNLSLGRAPADRISVSTAPDIWTIDFLPADQLVGQRSREISERTVLAMYFSNRAAEQMMLGQLDAAYWSVRAALDQDPHFVGAYNTLGVIYRRHAQPVLAEAVFRHVVGLEPTSPVGLLNLQLVLRDQGREAEAGAIAERLAKLDSAPPYKFFDLGLVALRAGQFQEAKRQFKREIERMAFVHEFHFSLALAHYALGELDEARQQLALAREYSATSQERLRYDSKLASLRGVRSGVRVPG